MKVQARNHLLSALFFQPGGAHRARREHWESLRNITARWVLLVLVDLFELFNSRLVYLVAHLSSRRLYVMSRIVRGPQKATKARRNAEKMAAS